MKEKKSLLLLLFTFFFMTPAHSELSLGSILPELHLSEGRLDGTPWKLSDSLKEKKITVIFYVDPDEENTNEEISEALLKKDYPSAKVQYIAIINLAATWLPNFAIAAALEKKQKKYPDTLYLKDYDKSGVKAWNVQDDQNDVIVLDKEGKVIFSKFGSLTKEEQERLLKDLDKRTIASP